MAGAKSIYEGGSPVSTDLTLFLVQLCIIVTACRLVSLLFKYIKQPPVIAEVITGILLGPSAFGFIPHFTETIFPAKSLAIFGVIANIGLITYMFIVGLEIDTRLMKQNWKQSISISVSAMICPFVLGIASSWVIFHETADPGVAFSNFLLFVGVAMSITAFPVLARIITQGRLARTKVGSIALSAAAVDDVVAWCILAAVVSIARSSGHLTGLWTFMVLIGFCLTMFFVVKPLLERLALGRKRSSDAIQFEIVALIFVLIFFTSWFTEIIGVHAIFGAFILGIVTPRKKKFAAKLTERIEDIIIIIFLPLFFTLSGLKTNITELKDGTSWGLVFLVIATACIGKITGGTIAAKLNKNTWRESLTVGILMNTKGLVELIVLNIGLEVKILNTRSFSIFVLMAIFTTMMTTPIVHFLYIRPMEKMKQAKQHAHRKGVFGMLMYISDVTKSEQLGRLIPLFNHRSETVTLKALLFKKINDRPSTYYFSELYKKKDISILLNKPSNLGLLEMKRKAEESNVEFRARQLISSSPAADCVDYLERKDYDLILFEIANTNAIKVADGIIEKGLEKIEGAFDWGSTNGQVVSHCIHNVQSNIGVLISRTKLSENITNILLIWEGRKYEELALNTAVQMIKSRPDIRLEVLSHDPHFIKSNDLNPDQVNLILIKEHTDHENQEVESILAVVNQKEYDLVLMGAERKNPDAYTSSLIVNNPCNIMLLYPSEKLEYVLQELP